MAERTPPPSIQHGPTPTTALSSACASPASRAAFDVVVERHRRQVYQLCYRYVGNHEDAADLAQDAFIRAFKGLKGFKGESSLSTWLYRIAVNVCLNRLALKAPQGQPLEPGERLSIFASSALTPRSLRDERARGSPGGHPAAAAEAACDVDSSDLS